MIQGTFENIIPATKYKVQIELMLTDLSHVAESATITLTPHGETGITIGTCDGGNSCDGCCTWFDCKAQLTTDEIISTSTRMEVKLEYSSSVTDHYSTDCTDSITGKSGAGVARITLTPLGKKKDLLLVFIELPKKFDFIKLPLNLNINTYFLLQASFKDAILRPLKRIVVLGIHASGKTPCVFEQLALV